MEKLIKDNYDSIVKRGLIKPETNTIDFLRKLDEEVSELWGSLDRNLNSFDEEELADVILVCLNMAHHYGIDIETELKNKIKINQNR